MQNDSNYSELLDRILTVEDANQVTEEVESLISSYYQKDLNFEKTLETKVSLETAKIIKKMVSDNQKNHEEIFKDLHNYIQELEIVEVTIAFFPQLSFIKYLSGWVRENLDKSTVLEIKVDKTIIAGIIIIYKGKYIDLSILKRLKKENFFSSLQK